VKRQVALDDVLPASLVLSTLRAFRRGDFEAALPLGFTGIAGEIAQELNDVAALNRRLTLELARVSMVVGKEGKLAQRATLGEVGGSWASCVESVNALIEDLVQPTNEVGRVIGAVASGDLSQMMTLEIEGRPLRGEFLRTAKVVNGMVEQLGSFASEVTRVAREVGTEGKLGGQAKVKGVAGTWKDLTDNVNLMAGNLTAQVRSIAEVTTAVARGDLSKKITVDVKGEILELKNTINTMVDQLNSFASEVTRVAREVGTEGKLGGQAQVPGVSGTWEALTDSVNFMASNLTAQVRNIAEVTTAVATGDLSKKITVDVRGEILELKNTINTMVDQLNSFASEVTRVAREVGTEGQLGGQAQVPGVSGTWKDLTDGVNSMASNLTGQVRNIAEVTTAVATGDLSKKITVDVRGEILALKNTINTMVDQLNAFASEVTRVAREVGTEGRLGGQAYVKGVAGTWKDLTDSVNFMASNLTDQVRNIADVTTAVARGDLSRKITVDVKGEILELKNTINVMVDQLNAFASEVTRVAREVGTEGKLGGQAHVQGVAGTWKDLTDNVNSMATNLTNQVRGIAKVVTAVARGDLTRKLALEASGEIAELADTINSMTDTLAIFAEQVITVAREVGVEGKLGGQAKVPGAAGTWRGLTDNVNQLAANLTTQVRAIGDVATAVTKGDLTRTITVEASGEVAALKDNINEMIRNLKETTQKTTEQDWLKTNLARFSRMMQGQRDLVTVAEQILSELAPLVSAQKGVFYITEGEDDRETRLKLLASYAAPEEVRQVFRLGEGLVGQCAYEKRKILLMDMPVEHVRIRSGLGESAPRSLLILPVLFEGRVNAVIELASFDRFSSIHQVFLDQLTESIGIVVNTIAASMRTEGLLQQSQSLTQELQSQQEELRQTNERLERQAATLRESEERLKLKQEELQQTNEQLEDKAKLLEIKNREVEYAKAEIEEKAEQLALTSKYKSEFLANMSHELRTPLNSLLILSKMLSDNAEHNLTAKQVGFAHTIHGSGTDLLALINDILDLSKIESGTITVEPSDVMLADLRSYVEQNFRHVAQQKGLEFSVELEAGLPPSILTDSKRLQQVLKNLLSNAFKFTEHGAVTMEVRAAGYGWSRDHELLNHADLVVAFSVTDTGIGIPEEKQRIIFEAFQQADGTTSRRYGGTGLGLSISREIARLLGGEIRVVSLRGTGSTFTFYLPRHYVSLPQPTGALRAPEPGRFLPMPVQAPDAAREPAPPLERTDDDRENLEPGDRVVLIVEDDQPFARIVADTARLRGLKVVIASDGASGIQLARKLKPSAIALDLRLPDVEGWLVLDRLKHDAATRHIPIAIFSADEQEHRALRLGAACFVQKPTQLSVVEQTLAELLVIHEGSPRRLLLVEDNEAERDALVELIGGEGVQITAVGSAEAALKALEGPPFQCLVTDLGLPDMNGFALLGAIQTRFESNTPPVIVYTGRDLTEREEVDLRRLADVIIVKDVSSPERLLYETSLRLHRESSQLSARQQQLISELEAASLDLDGAKILVVDDDVRNIFAMTSALESHGANVIYAENGRDGLALLETNPDVRAVLMDIMMPEMDGYEVMRRIRQEPSHRGLPVIAVTAKAMRSDREKCIQAGASDYIAKPVDLEHLLSLLRIWVAS
jgi:HAMP domain-containing protein/CheY-like chemotaxis protein/signal transduction histidine kinase